MGRAVNRQPVRCAYAAGWLEGVRTLAKRLRRVMPSAPEILHGGRGH